MTTVSNPPQSPLYPLIISQSDGLIYPQPSWKRLRYTINCSSVNDNGYNGYNAYNGYYGGDPGAAIGLGILGGVLGGIP